jgi:hypothetical protein
MTNVPNRFTQTRFNNAASAKVAEGKMLTAYFGCTGNVWRASVTWKQGFAGSESLTAFNETAMRSALLKLDSSLRFLDQRPSVASAVADKDAAILEAMRTDPKVDDRAYRMACHSLRLPIQLRPNFSEQRVAPVVILGLEEQGSAMLHFLQQHPELAESGHENYNVGLITQWHKAEQVQVTATTLAQAFAEIHGHSMFRMRTAGLRGGELVRPFDMGLIRSDRTKNGPVAPRAITKTQASLQKIASKTDVLAAARAQVLVQRPDLAKDVQIGGRGESAEMRKLVDAVLRQWAKESNPNMLG